MGNSDYTQHRSSMSSSLYFSITKTHIHSWSGNLKIVKVKIFLHDLYLLWTPNNQWLSCGFTPVKQWTCRKKKYACLVWLEKNKQRNCRFVFLPLLTFTPAGDILSLASGGQMLIEGDTGRCSFEKGHCTGK